jgi:hypothetical protein
LKGEIQGNTLLLGIKLDQRVHYEQGQALLGIGNRQDMAEFPHYRYMQNHGRPLIESVVIRRGSKPLEVTEQKPAEGGGGDEWLKFAAVMDNASLGDLWVDLNLKCVDQTITLTDGLFAGPVGASLREQQNQSTSGGNR